MAGKFFSRAKGMLNNSSIKSATQFLTLGYSGNDLLDEYAVTITDKRPKRYSDRAGVPQTIIIRAPLQEKISTRTVSTWAPLSAAAFAQNIFGTTALLFTGRTLVSQYASRRIWTGTSPLDFTLNLKFEAINDTDKEVFQPILELQRMSLPFTGDKDSMLAKAFLAPPGPNPFELDISRTDGRLKKLASSLVDKDIYENITVKIGTLMEIKKAIVIDISIQHSPKFDNLGKSVEAIASVHFQTFEIITKESLDDIYSPISVAKLDSKVLKDQSSNGLPGFKSVPAENNTFFA